jgi:hypothetical protein
MKRPVVTSGNKKLKGHAGEGPNMGCLGVVFFWHLSVESLRGR